MKAPGRISANVAEKPKRGRPARHSPAALVHLAQLFKPELDGRKDRARKLRMLAVRQEGLSLVLKHRLAWLADPKVIAAGGHARLSICAELGALLAAGWSEGDVLAEAQGLCEERPSTKAAIARLRNLRKRASAGDTVHLARALERTLNDYFARHPGFGWSEAVAALEFVLDECREAAAGEPPDGS